MGSIDKLIKALENLRVFQPEVGDDSASNKKKVEPLTNKEKILNCNMLADSICSSNVRSAAEFPNFLGVVIETLLSYANDKESDVRMVSDECLNRITKALLDTNLGRLQVEFYKELKKNGPSRCMRSALWRFAELSPLIRPQKRRAYVVNLLPCVVKMAERHEEALQECLMTSMSNICVTLMAFASDLEIKSYLAPFISNLCSTSAVVRRVASTSASLIAQHSRKPLQLFNWLLLQVLDMVLPIMHSTSSENMPIILGSLHCIRSVIPFLTDITVLTKSKSGTEPTKIDHNIKLDSTIMLFELVIHCLQQSHPSVTTAALECYQQLLRSPLPGLVELLLTPGSITQSVLAMSYEATLAAHDDESSHVELELAVEDSDSNAPLEELTVNLAIKSDARSSENQSPVDMLPAEETLDSPAQKTSTINETERSEVSQSPECEEKGTTELIGCLTDPDNPPIMFSARLLCRTFLLTGSSEERLYADKEIRVSIKSLALSCISCILKLYPQCMERQLYITEHAENNQPISDILLYYNHVDPQIQGVVAQMVGNLLHSIIHRHTESEHDTHQQDVEKYISMLMELLNNDNSMATRLVLSALRTCVNTILNSKHQHLAVELIERASKHNCNSYWLVKVELLDLISEIHILPFVRLAGPAAQTRILNEVVFLLLGDSDHRVRQSASATLVRLTPGLYFPSDHSLHSILLAKASCDVSKLIYPFLSEFPTECPPMVHGLPHPYHLSTKNGTEAGHDTVQSSLSRVVYQLLDMFSTSSSQHTKLGVCHALFELSETFPVTKYPHAWSCAPGTSCVRSRSASHNKLDSSTSSSLRSLMVMDELKLGSGGGPLTLIMSLLTHSPISLDLSVHQDLLVLAGNLISGACLSALKQGQSNSASSEKSWPGIYDRLLVPSADKLLSHIIKLLNIFFHVLEDTTLSSSANPKAVLDAAREAITSPIKKRVTNKQEAQATDLAPEPKTAKEAEKAMKNRKETLGTFNHSPFYMKLHEAVKGAHLNYKVSLSLSKMDKFGSMLHHTLAVFSQLLEVASLQEIGKCAEEILDYLKSTVLASPVATVGVVHQLLKALFGTNLSSQFEDLVEKKVISRSSDIVSGSAPATVIKPGLFTCCLSTPYSELAQSLAHNPFRVETDDHHNSIYVIKKCQERKMPAVLKPGASVDKNTVGAYIRLFEPLVIKSLKMYTMSSSVALQTQVLNLLVQLIQLRVNYCLLDNDEVFLGYVLKQIDMISEGPPSEQAGLIRCIFQLLLLLSYEKLHSKTLVVVPRIMQLCDGVMASGQNPETHAIPALEMLVKDLFLSRSTNTSSNTDTAFHDIETQREVTASMLLRLIHHTKVLGLLSIVLYQLMRESEEKWKKLSRQVIDLVLPLATRQQIELESQEAMFTLHNILLAVSPSVYRPVDSLLKALFTQPDDLESRVKQQRWMSTVLAILRVLLLIGKEEVLLSRLSEIEITFDRGFMASSMMSHMTSSSSGVIGHMSNSNALSQSSESLVSSSFGAIPPQDLLASFLTQIICLCTERLAADIQCSHIHPNEYQFSLQQLSLLLLFISHMLQSGHFRKVAKYMMEQLRIENSLFRHTTSDICNHMMWMGAHYPTLTLQWSNILMLLNFEDQSWWKLILRTDSHDMHDGSSSTQTVLPLNHEIIKSAGLAMYCDYVVENLHDAEHLTWLTVNHVNEIIDQMHETPVQDFMSAVYSNPSASGLFISAVQSRYKPNSNITKLRNVVTCLRNMHKDQSGAVLVLLVDKIMLTCHAAISRMCDSVACRRVEVLLAEDKQTVHKELTEEDLMRILVTLHSSKQRHRRLLSLVEKLRASFFSTVIPPDTPTFQAVTPPLNKIANKQFYLQLTRYVCSSVKSSARLCSSLLGSLETPDILAIMSEDTFQLKCLSQCIEHGANKSVRTDTGTVIDLSEANGVSSQELSPLLDASEQILKQIWAKIVNPTENELTVSLDESMIHHQSSGISVEIVNATSSYLQHCPQSLENLETSELEAICNIAVTYFDKIKPSPDLLTRSSSQIMHSWTSHVDDMSPDRAPADIYKLYSNLSLLGLILKNKTVNAVFSANQIQVFSIIDSLAHLLRGLNVPGLSGESEDGREALMMSQDGYVQISELVTCLSDVLLPGKSCLPPSLVNRLDTAIRGLARLPCVNEHARMPVSAFIISEPRGDNHKPELRADALQDTPVLREFIKRNNLLGWISRHQFEETWACLLHLLSPVAVTGADDISEEDDVENIEWMVSALRGITGLLCHTLNKTEQGNTLHKCYRHVHRQRRIQALNASKIGEKLYELRIYLEQKSPHSCDCMRDTDLFCRNLERTSCDISYNQLSVDYLTTKLSIPPGTPSIPNLEKADVEKTEKSGQLPTAKSSSDSVDVASCLKLLIDVYTHLLSPTAHPKTPLMLLNECAKSTLVLSDLFYERGQFEWMFNTLQELHQSHHSGEDELMNQYVVLGLCKAAAIHEIDSSSEEKLHKLIETSLKSTHIPTKLAAMNGSLYLLESARDSDLMKSLLAILIDCISKTMDSLISKHVLMSEVHLLTLWSLTFYLIEHYLEQTRAAPTLIPKILQLAVQLINSSENDITTKVYSAVLYGFERLLLTNSVSKQEAVTLLKLASDRLAMPTMHLHVHSVLGLLITCMYADISDNDDNKEQLSEVKMELVSILFDRIRRGLPQEAELITGILPPLMSNLFTSQDIMNKVIGEFLSEQQAHPTLIARMIYEVFEQQMLAGGSAVLHEWVLLSVSSFTQRNPLATAIWSLSCFFVSASANDWLKGLFPFVSSRIGLLEPVDEMVFVIGCKDFYESLANDVQKRQTFISVFQSAARNEQIYKTALEAMTGSDGL